MAVRAQERSKAGREVSGACGGEEKSLAVLKRAGREGSVGGKHWSRVESAKGASSGDFWGMRSPGKEKEKRVWKAVCIAFLKFANTCTC